MERSTSEIDSWVDELKISIIEDNEKKIHEMCTNIPEDLVHSARFEEAYTLISGAIEEFKKRREDTKRILDSLARSKKHFRQQPRKKGRLDIKS
jgi:prefoldin subunit 5